MTLGNKIWLGFILFLAAGVSPMLWAADFQYIQIREATVREKPQALGKVVGSLPYTTAVKILEKSGSWVRVASTAPNVSGWISASALTVKNLALKAGAGGGTSASSSEVALAGKGFNQEIEAEYRSQNAGLDYDWVDRMEAIQVDDELLRQFLAAGPQGALK